MKKIYLTILMTLSCGLAVALPVGNPCEASFICDGLVWEGHCGCDPCDPCLTWCDAFSIRGGFYGDYVFERNLQNHRNNRGGGGKRNRKKLEHSRIYTNAGYIALNFWDKFDVFGTLGSTNLDFDGNISSFSPFVFLSSPPVDNPRVIIETSSEFSWSVGARTTLWECGCTALGVEGQYFRTDPRIKRVTFAGFASTYPSNTLPRLRTQYSEWQIGLGVSHRINFLIPYAALKWSGARLHPQNKGDESAGPFNGLFPIDNGALITFNDLVNQKMWGYAVGFSIVDCEKAAFTLEGRFGDERALYVNGQIRF